MEFSVVEVALTGFRFIRAHPRTVITWAVVIFAVSLLAGIATVTLAGPELAQLRAMRDAQSTNPGQALAMMGRLVPFFALMLVYALAFYAVWLAAVARAVLRPDESAFAYLRFGGDELRQGLLLLLLFLVALCAYAVVVIGAIAVGVGGALALRSAGPIAVGLLTIVIVVAALGAWIAFWTRLSLAWPLTFDSRQVNLFGSWGLTRGRFWKLFGCYLLVMAIALLLGTAMAATLLIAGGAGAGGTLAGLARLFQPDTRSLAAYFTPMGIARGAVEAIGYALIGPIVLAPAVEIYRRLTVNPAASF